MQGFAEEFARFADCFSDALLLVTRGGEIHAANGAARQLLLGGVAPRPRQALTEFVAEPLDKIRDYLRLCARSATKLPGTLTFVQVASNRVGAQFHCEGWACRSNGESERFVLLRAVPKKDSVQRFASLNQQIERLSREVTRRLHAERDAHEQQEMLRVTLASIGDAVITTDTDGCVTFLNPVAERLTGWTQTEALSRHLDEVFVIRHEETGAVVESPVTKVLQHGRVVGLANHTALIRKDRTQIPIDDSGAPIRDATGQMFGVVLVFHEISERRAMERRLLRQAEALREADRRKDEFLAMLAHELRNPLAPLHNAVQILRLQGRNGDIEEITALMERQTAQLTRLVDDLLDIARITRGTIQLEKHSIALVKVLDHAIETVQPLIDAREHDLEVQPPPENLTVNADFTRLSQVFCNLLNNAAKFMTPGGKITVRASGEDGHAVISVRDEGAGMDRNLLSRVFDLFIQAERSLDRREGGLGLGLTLAKTLVQMHGGEISAFSEGPGRGSEFFVRLPAGDRTAAVPQERDLAHGELGVRVLVVDDNADAAESLGILLTSWGCQVRIASDGQQALAIAASDPPDVVLLDIGLPGMDGYEVALRLRRMPDMGTVRIIAVTGYGRDSDRERSQQAGFDEHLTKPVKLDALRALLEFG